MQAQNQYLGYLIDPNFQGVNTLFVLSFENNAVSTGHTECRNRKIEVRDYNEMIDSRNLFDQPVKNDIRAYDNMIVTSKKKFLHNL